MATAAKRMEKRKNHQKRKNCATRKQNVDFVFIRNIFVTFRASHCSEQIWLFFIVENINSLEAHLIERRGENFSRWKCWNDCSQLIDCDGIVVVENVSCDSCNFRCEEKQELHAHAVYRADRWINYATAAPRETTETNDFVTNMNLTSSFDESHLSCQPGLCGTRKSSGKTKRSKRTKRMKNNELIWHCIYFFVCFRKHENSGGAAVASFIHSSHLLLALMNLSIHGVSSFLLRFILFGRCRNIIKFECEK